MSEPLRKIASGSERTSAVLYAGIVIIGVAGAVGLLVQGKIMFGLFTCACALAMAIGAVRTFRGGVFASSSELISKTEFRTKAIEWSRIEKFEYKSLRGIGAFTKERRWIPIVYVQPRQAKIDLMMNALSRELDLYR